MKNLVAIEGNVGAAPEFKAEQNLTKFSVALNEKWVKNGVESKRTTWVNVEVWGDLAVSASRLKKGDSVRIDGRLRNSDYEKDGVKHYRTVVVVSTLRVNDWSIFGDGANTEDQGGGEDDANVPY